LFDWLRRRRLSNEAKRKLLLAAARAEEALVETHVANVMEMMALLEGEIDVDRGLELYHEMLPMDEHISATVTNRVLARYDARGAQQQPARRFENVFRDGGR
jgi:hypothetical protein